MGLDCVAGSSTVIFSGAHLLANGHAADIADDHIMGWETVDYDTDAYFNMSSDSTMITTPFAGYYSLGASIGAITPVSTVRNARFNIYLDGYTNIPFGQSPIYRFDALNQQLVIRYETNVKLAQGVQLFVHITQDNVDGNGFSYAGEFWAQLMGRL